jgi:hypothetical protein
MLLVVFSFSLLVFFFDFPVCFANRFSIFLFWNFFY